MRVSILLMCSLVIGAPTARAAVLFKADDATGVRDVSKLVDATKSIVAAIVEAGKKNQQLPRAGTPGAQGPFRHEKDDLTAYYLREAARAAQKLPAEQAVPAYLLALGIAMDDSDLMRNNLVTRTFWRKVESSEDFKRRVAVLGEPTIQGRHDLCQHFAVSAALTAMLGEKNAESAGIVKEILDSRDGGSGFSFNDLSADLAGVAFAKQLLQKPKLLGRIPETFKVADYTIAPMYEPEGLPAKDFAKLYGSISDERFLSRVSEIRTKLALLPGLKAMPEEKP